MSGKKAEYRLDQVGVTCNKNTVPFDPRSPFITSGIRLGTPAMTSRGMNETDMDEIADIIHRCLMDFEGEKKALRQRVKKLTERYPLPY